MNKRGSKDNTKSWLSNWENGICIPWFISIKVCVHACICISTEKGINIKNDNSGLS